MINRLIRRFPEQARFLFRYFDQRKTTVCKDCLLCVAITLTCSFYHFEQYQPMMELLRGAIILLFALVWLLMSFSNGFRRRHAFLFFMIAYWSVPNLFIFWQSRLEGTLHYSKTVYFLSKLSELLIQYPQEELGKRLLPFLPFSMVMIAFLALCVILFEAGFEIRRHIDADLLHQGNSHLHINANYNLFEKE